MKISTRCRYAVRALLDLALHSNGNLVLLKDIAKRQQISIKYLESIFSALRKAGIITGSRGAKGGYLLLKKTSEVTIYDIVFTMQGFIAPVGCIDDACTCNRTEECVTREIWDDLTNSIADTLKRYTLADLVSRHGRGQRERDELSSAAEPGGLSSRVS